MLSANVTFSNFFFAIASKALSSNLREILSDWQDFDKNGTESKDCGMTPRDIDESHSQREVGTMSNIVSVSSRLRRAKQSRITLMRKLSR
ncbi:MAG TPA: hypothetical protein VJS37_11270 [Terriglobales bacterium]|nr:hypothetical protein [Terriglobales bacterium]